MQMAQREMRGSAEQADAYLRVTAAPCLHLDPSYVYLCPSTSMSLYLEGFSPDSKDAPKFLSFVISKLCIH